jgi:small-conductance mechanosensitive channel
MNSFWNNIFLGNSLKDWTIALVIILATFAVLKFTKMLALIRLRKWASKTNTTIDDFIVAALGKYILPFFYLLACYIGLSYLSLPTKTDHVLTIALLVAGTFFAIGFITALAKYFIENFTRSHSDADTKRKQARGIIVIINIVVWITGIIFLIDNLGYDITTLVTGLGIGGVAIALAAQAILGDLFSYFVIFFDKPFEIGDFIIVGDKLGTVEYVGIKTTRIRALSGEQLIMSNTDLTNSRVQNYKRMEKRRVVSSIGVIYETSPEKLRKIPTMLKEIIHSQNQTEFDRAHFSAFADFSLNFEFVYYITGADYNLYMDRQQAINLAIFEAFEREGIEFAYPTRKIYLDTQSISVGGQRKENTFN